MTTYMDMSDLVKETYVYGTDVRARIADLESDRDAYIDDRLGGEGDETMHDAYAAEWATENPDDAEELEKLQEFDAEATGYAGDGADYTAIKDTDFVTYAESVAEDITSYDSQRSAWPFTCIDWDEAADELKQDYTEVELDGVAFQVRS